MVRDIFSEKLRERLPSDEWLISQESYDPKENLKYESLFALSNGYLGIRGSYEEGTSITLPYLYINGVFDKSETFMRELAALPNWLGIGLYAEKAKIGVETCQILEFCRVLDMKNATLSRRMVFRDAKGRETLVEGIRFVSRNNVHRMGIRLYVTPLNWSGILEVEDIIDGSIINFYDAPRFKVKHTYITANEALDEAGNYIEAATRDNHLHVGTGSLTVAYLNGEPVSANRMFHAFGEQASEFSDVSVREGQCVEIVKYVSMYTERECPAWNLHTRIEEEIRSFCKDGFDAELEAHASVYDKMWENANVTIGGDETLDRAVRFNIFHLMSTGNEHDDRVNVGAKLLTGEEYGGHAFWDTELFMLPFFAYVFPDTARNLENYRYHLLDAARENARKNGYKGAQYPWESADDGSEQCPDWTIEPDGTCYRCYVAVYEHHVTAAVAYGIYNYVKITKDKDFLYSQGAEILTETARFWASRCEYVAEKDRYEITRVTGPDEWHEPVDNNLYTNYLARWNLRYVAKLAEEMKASRTEAYQDLVEKTGLSEEEIAGWKKIQEKIYLPRKEGTDLLEQFEGYFQLDDVTIEKYDENDWPVKPEILKKKNKAETQIIKQADVVMLLHLMGEEFTPEMIRLNYGYYEKRTLHGSSLSPSIYSVMGLKVGDDSKAYRYLRRAALLDLLDLQGNSREGIHAANTGGVWQTVIFGFAGVEAEENGVLKIHPNMPEEWESLTFRLHYLGAWLEIAVDGQNQAQVTRLSGNPVRLEINGEVKEV